MTVARARAHASDRGLLPAAVHYPARGHDAVTEFDTDRYADHLSRYGTPTVSTDDLLRQCAQTGLAGRGGGFVEVAAKWRRVAARRLQQAEGTVLVVANAAEGEPDSRKDAALVEFRPHLVLDGLVAAAQAVHADAAVVWLHDDAHAPRSALTRALAERTDPLPVRMALAPRHYLAGESSAVAAAVRGGMAARPTSRQERATLPVTLMHNAETLARIALLHRGIPSSSALLTVAGVDHLVVVEVPADRTLAHAARAAVGDREYSALLVGGYGGRWIPRALAASTTLEAAMRRGRQAALLGAGIIAPHLSGCPLERTAAMLDHLAANGAGQCGPCRFGLPAAAELFAELASRRRTRRAAITRLDRYLGEVDGRGACHHPDGAVRLARSAMDVFADEVAAHRRGRCPAAAA